MPAGEYPRAARARRRECVRLSWWHACAGLAAALLLQACHSAGVLDPQGPISMAERLILLNATVIMLVVVLPVIVLTLAFA